MEQEPVIAEEGAEVALVPGEEAGQEFAESEQEPEQEPEPEPEADPEPEPPASEVERRFAKAMLYKDLLEMAFFAEDSWAARAVTEEVGAFVRERMEVLLGMRAAGAPAASPAPQPAVAAPRRVKVARATVQGGAVPKPAVRVNPKTAARKQPPKPAGPTAETAKIGEPFREDGRLKVWAEYEGPDGQKSKYKKDITGQVSNPNAPAVPQGMAMEAISAQRAAADSAAGIRHLERETNTPKSDEETRAMTR